MSIVELFLLAVGLSMDAFAVSIGKGLSMRRLNMKHAALIALFFGGFQALMPLAGWALGRQFSQAVSQFSGIIAFALLSFIGAKMIWDAVRGGGDGDEAFKLNVAELLALAVATSIDAFAAGIALAVVDANIVFSVAFIGVVTFCLSLVGVAVGHQFGSRWEKPATIAGGVILIGIGVKLLFGM